MDDAASINVAGEEGQDVAALQFANDLDRHLIRFRATDDRRETRHTAVHQLDAPRAKLNIIDGTIQMTIQVIPIACAGIRAGEGGAAGKFESGHGFRLKPVHKANCFNGLRRKEGGHARV